MLLHLDAEDLDNLREAALYHPPSVGILGGGQIILCISRVWGGGGGEWAVGKHPHTRLPTCVTVRERQCEQETEG